MIRIHKPSTMIIMTVLLVSTLCLSTGQAQAQTSYIIVHALNPEGVEIASIEGNGGTLPFSVEIFDGAEHIGYAPQNAETHNVPIPIRPGDHTIRALFNGMTQEQVIVLNPGETHVLTLIFERTNYADEIRNKLVKTYTKTLSISDMTVSPGYDSAIYGASLGCETFDEESCTMGSFYIWYCSADASITIEVSASLSQDLLRLQKTLTQGTASFRDIYPECYGVRVYGVGHIAEWNHIVSLPSICDTWFIQGDQGEGYLLGGLVLTCEDSPYESGCFGVRVPSIGEVYIQPLPPGTYMLSDRDFEWIGEYQNAFWIDEYGNACCTEEIDNFGSVQDFRLSELVSNVPYDLLGTGIKCGGEEPPECAFSAKDPVWQNEADEMVLPYDEVDLKFEFTNTAKNAVSNTKVLFLSNSIELMTLEKAIEDIGDVAAGATFTATNRIKIAGTDNSGIMEEIVNVGGSGRLSLKDMIDVHVTADECSAPCEFSLSPTDEKDNILSIQYPDFSNLADIPVPSDDEGGFYRDQGDIDFHHPSNDLVRKYAVEASAYKYKNNDFLFPDTISEVLENIYYYIIDLIDADMPYPPANDEDITSKINKTIFPKPPYEESHICITHAYLFGSFARTIGIPAREITIALGTSIGRTSQYVFGIFYPAQEAAVQVWYDDAWHLYDTYLEQRSLDGYLYLKRYFAYRAWYSFNRQNTLSFSGLSLKGHNFSIKPLTGSISDGYEYQWKHLHDDIRPGIVIVTNSPVYTYVIDKAGRKTGLFDGQVLQEITESYYLPSGLRTYTDASDPDSFVEGKETIFVAQSGQSGDYSLVITGTDDGHYELTLAYIHGDGEIDGSTVQFDIRKDETHTFHISVSDDGEISTTRIPACVDVGHLVSISLGRVSYDRRTGQFSVDVKVTNNSQTVIGGPVCLVIETISNPAVTLAGSDGTTIDGKPYMDLSGLLGNGQFDAGETISKRIYFNNPNRVQFTFKPSVRGVIVP